MIPDEIERVALLGWRVYPCSRSSKAARFKDPSANASCDLDLIQRWVDDYPASNWRVVMEGSGIWALDVDAPGADHDADGLAAMGRLVAKHGALPLRPTTRSGGGGVAMFFRHDEEPIHGKTGYPEPGLDPRRGRLSVTIPPSIHLTTRKPYEWLVKPWEVDPPAAPTWLLNAVKPPPEPARPRLPEVTSEGRAERRLRRAVDAILSAPKGTANDTLNRQSFAVARHVAGGTLNESEAAAALYAAARNRNIPDYEARDTIKSGFKGGYAKPLTAEARP